MKTFLVMPAGIIMAQKNKPTASQADNFKTAARELGCDESEDKFDAALKKVASHKPSRTEKPGKRVAKSKFAGK